MLARATSGQLERRPRGRGLRRKGRLADVAIDLEAVSVLTERARRRRAQRAREALGSDREEREAAAAHPVDAPVGADGVAQLPSQPLEQRVAARVAVGVVVVLEPVEREQVQRQDAIVAGVDRLLQVRDQPVVRRQPGDRIDALRNRRRRFAGGPDLIGPAHDGERGHGPENRADHHPQQPRAAANDRHDRDHRNLGDGHGDDRVSTRRRGRAGH